MPGGNPLMTPFNNPLIRFVSEPKYRWLRHTLFILMGFILAFKGDVGDALLFRNATDDGRPDPESLHAGLPVTSGEKLLASRWIRQKPFGPRT